MAQKWLTRAAAESRAESAADDADRMSVSNSASNSPPPSPDKSPLVIHAAPGGYWYYANKSSPHVAYHHHHAAPYYPAWPTQMHVQAQSPQPQPSSRRRLFAAAAPAAAVPAASEFVSQAPQVASHQVAAARLLSLQLLQAASPVGVALKAQLLDALTAELHRQREALSAKASTQS